MQDPTPSVLIVGAGAIGALYGAALARQGARVAVVCRSDFEAVRRSGYRIRSALLGDHQFVPADVLRDVADCVTPPDYLVLTVKVLHDVDRVALIRSAVGPRTVIVLIENGIDIEAEIAAAFPGNELLSVLAFVAVSRTAQGEIHHQSLGSLVMGRYPAGITPAAQKLAALFEASGVRCKLTDDVIGARWQKAMWNATFNPISIMGGVLDTGMMLKTAEDRALAGTVMDEVRAIAAAEGHPLPPQLVQQMIANTIAMPPYKTSMALDFENGRPMEIDAILGAAVRIGRRHGVAMPALETLYALASMIERARTGA